MSCMAPPSFYPTTKTRNWRRVNLDSSLSLHHTLEDISDSTSKIFQIMILFLYLHLQCHHSGPYHFPQGLRSNLSSPPSLSLWIQPSYPKREYNHVLHLLKSFDDYQLSSQQVPVFPDSTSYTPHTAPALTCAHFPRYTTLKPQCCCTCFLHASRRLFQPSLPAHLLESSFSGPA